MIVFDGIIFCLQQWGGISVYFNELMNRVNAHNISNEVILFGSSVPSQIDKRLVGINYRFVNTRYCERYRRCQVSEQTKLFHSSYYRLPMKDVPVVTTVYDFTYERALSGPRRWVHSSQKLNAVRNSNAVICISNSTRQDLLEYLPKIPPEVVHVIHLGANESFAPLSSNGGDLLRPFALFVGGRSGYKNFNLAVEAVSRIPGLDFVCVGGGDLRHQESRLLNQILPNRWRHERFVAVDRLNYLYNKAMCLIYPSSYEGFGMPVLEAMRAGCPVIAFRGSSIPEVVGDAALLLDMLDPLALTAMIQKALDTSERDRLRKLGYMRASEFSWKKTFESTLRVYEQLLGKPLLERNSKVET